MSTLKAAVDLRVRLLTFQRDYYKEMQLEASVGRARAWVFGDEKDPSRTWHLAEILHRHGIQFHELKGDFSAAGKRYKKGSAYIVPIRQKNPRLLKAMFERRTRFQDSLFYDISAWTFPLAFNMDYTEMRSLSNAGPVVDSLQVVEGAVDQQGSYAYLFEWHGYYSPKALNMIAEKGLRAKVAKSPFKMGERAYDYGTVMIPVQNQQLSAAELYEFLQQVAVSCQLEIHGVNTGMTDGIDLGSNSFDPIKKQKVAVLVGKGIRSYDAGEIWHLFDTRYGMKITKIDMAYAMETDFSKYTDIILPSSWNKPGFPAKLAEKLNDWVKSGGSLIGYRNSLEWMSEQGLIKLGFKKDTLVAKNIRFDQKEDFEGAQETGGAIFETRIDRSHPIAFGYKNDRLPVFKNSNVYLEPDEQSYNNPILFTSRPLLSGYISEENSQLLRNSAYFKTVKKGKGRVIVFSDNTNFRAFWYGTNKLLMNAIFFGNMM